MLTSTLFASQNSYANLREMMSTKNYCLTLSSMSLDHQQHHHIMDFTVTAICKGLSTLPQELYDQIHKAVFTASANKIRNLNSPALDTSLKLMHLSHGTRELYATTFYSADFEYEATVMSFMQWLTVVPTAHRNRIKKLTNSGDHRHLFLAMRNWGGAPCIVHQLTEGPMLKKDVAICPWYLRALVAQHVGEEMAEKVFLKFEGVEWNGWHEVVEGGETEQVE